MSSIPVKEFFEAAVNSMVDILKDKDPYVCKTGTFAVAKLWDVDAKIVEERGLVSRLNGLLESSNPTVVASALAALMDITEKAEDLQLTIDKTHAFNLAHILPDCNE